MSASVIDTPAPFQQGQAVRVVSGPFTGFEGVVAHTAKERVAVLLELLGREQELRFHPGALDFVGCAA